MVNNKENYKFDLGLEGLRTGLLGQLVETLLRHL